MAFSTISKSSSYFNSTIYTGNGTVDTALTTGTFQPDLTWFKNRGTTESHMWMDAVRGATNYIQSIALHNKAQVLIKFLLLHQQELL